jgi:hypothetical protein
MRGTANFAVRLQTVTFACQTTISGAGLGMESERHMWDPESFRSNARKIQIRRFFSLQRHFVRGLPAGSVKG